MRSLNRQKIKIHYSNYLGETEIMDDDGNYTGERENIYSDPMELRVSIGPNGGLVTRNPYGVAPEYDRVIISDDVNCPINETSIIWVDNNITEKHDYIVQSISKTLNSVAYGIKKVL